MALHRTLVVSSVLAVTGMLGMPQAHAAVSVSSSGTVPVRVSLTTSVTCSNNPGPTISLGGTIAVGTVRTAVWFQNNVLGTQSTAPQVTGLSFAVTPSQGTLTLAKAPVPLTGGGWLTGSTGAGGNPWISVDILNSAGTSAIGGPVLVGKCVQLDNGKFSVATSRSIMLPVRTTLLASALGCTSRASQVSVSTTSAYAGLTGRLLFDNNKTKAVHHAEAAGSATFSLMPPVTTTKGGWGVGGAGGNPLVYVHFMKSTDSGTNPLVWPPNLNLGRCNKLGA